jgi:hypothetical protein
MVSRFASGRSRRCGRQPDGFVALATALALLIGRPAAAREAKLGDLQPFIGHVVIIETNDRPQVIGRLVSAGDSAIVATVNGVETTLLPHEVRSVTADVDSMRIGLGIGAAVGVAAGILGAQGLSCSDCPGKIAAGAAFSIVAFSALGALIGKHHHRRVTVYRSPAPVSPPVLRR